MNPLRWAAIFALLQVLVIVLLSACGASSSAYQRAEKVLSLEPVLLTAVYALSDSGNSIDPKVAAAFNSAGALLTAYKRADAGKFDLMLPCTVKALREAAAVLPDDKAKALEGVAGVLQSLSPEGVCLPPAGDEDAGSAAREQQAAELPAYARQAYRLPPAPLVKADVLRDRVLFLVRSYSLGSSARVWA